MAMIRATVPSVRSVDLPLAGLRVPAGSWATATLASIQRIIGSLPWVRMRAQTIGDVLALSS
jgi:hypothetical protein